MKRVYPVIMEEGNDFVVVYFPNFDSGTQGENIPKAIEMARDAISMLGVTLEDEGRKIPEPSNYDEIKIKKGQIKTFIDVDFDDYRRKNETKTVKKNCTLPSWLCYEAEKANINFSAVLQEALKEKLNISKDKQLLKYVQKEEMLKAL